MNKQSVRVAGPFDEWNRIDTLHLANIELAYCIQPACVPTDYIICLDYKLFADRLNVRSQFNRLVFGLSISLVDLFYDCSVR